MRILMRPNQGMKLRVIISLRLIYDGNVAGLQTLGTLFDLEFYLLSFFKIPETLSLDCGIVNENILATLAGDESITLATIEPFYRTGCTL